MEKQYGTTITRIYLEVHKNIMVEFAACFSSFFHRPFVHRQTQSKRQNNDHLNTRIFVLSEDDHQSTRIFEFQHETTDHQNNHISVFSEETKKKKKEKRVVCTGYRKYNRFSLVKLVHSSSRRIPHMFYVRSTYALYPLNGITSAHRQCATQFGPLLFAKNTAYVPRTFHVSTVPSERHHFCPPPTCNTVFQSLLLNRYTIRR